MKTGFATYRAAAAAIALVEGLKEYQLPVVPPDALAIRYNPPPSPVRSTTIGHRRMSGGAPHVSPDRSGYLPHSGRLLLAPPPAAAGCLVQAAIEVSDRATLMKTTSSCREFRVSIFNGPVSSRSDLHRPERLFR